ncbi:hypothetical protein ACFCV8_28770 [Streptomyces sp. NPDC056347]|uniref:hypothetical protein n=1 Tax=Streptomyces sp. NPDC056347 TaxID=3345790 RepID=UPI0035DFFB3C
MEAEFEGEFETHLTVRIDSRAGEGAGAGREFGRLERWARERGLGLTHIVLDRGATPDQPMLTERGRGTLSGQRAAADRRAAELRAAGFPVVRVKIEAAPWNADVPGSAAEAAALPPGLHFEHHVKLLLSGEPEADVARRVAERHGARLSRNARRLTGPRSHERFVTQRCHAVGRPGARAELDSLLDALHDAGLEVLEVEEEFVVHDDRPAVDAGWLDAPAGTSR